MPLAPPTNPKETVFNLPHGQQIIVEMDTIHQRTHPDDPNPATSLLLEHGGKCWSFTLEDGVWWRNEYTGDAERVPQLQNRRYATELERQGREKARGEWEQRTQGNANSEFGGGMMPNAQAVMGGATGFSEASTQMDAQIRFPEASVGPQHNTWSGSPPHTVPNFPSANIGINAPSFGPPGSSDWVAPHPPSFPHGSPFAPNTWSGPPSFPPPGIPSPQPAVLPHAHEPGPYMPSAQRSHQINDGTYTGVGGRIRSTNMNQSFNVTRSDGSISWTPDRHQELNYEANWP